MNTVIFLRMTALELQRLAEHAGGNLAAWLRDLARKCEAEARDLEAKVGHEVA